MRPFPWDRFTALLVALLISMSMLASIAGGSDEEGVLQEPPAQFRASSANLGAVPGSAPMDNTTLWTVETRTPVLSSPVVVDGRLYVGTMGGQVLCLNAYSGSRLWEFLTDGPVESSPTVKDGRVYVGADDGNMYCLDMYEGTLLWNTSTDGPIKSSPKVEGGRVYFGSNDFSVYCLDADRGQVLWAFPTGGYCYSSPAVAGDGVFFGSCDGKVYRVNATTGEEVWQYLAAYAPASPAVTDDLVIMGTYDRNLYYLNRTTGEPVWNVTLGTDIYSSAAVWEGPEVLPVVFLADNAGTLYCIDHEGEVYWELEHEAGMTSSPILALDFKAGDLVGPMLVYADQGGTLYGREVHSPSDAIIDMDPNVAWSIKLGTSIQSSPFLYHCKVYIGAETQDGGVVACIGSLIEGAEGVIEVAPTAWYGQMQEDMVQVRGLIEGMVPDVLRVEFEGRTQEVEPQANGLFTALFGTERSEGPREVRVQAVVGDAIILEERAEVLVLVEGWSSIDIRIEEPMDGERIDGVFFARGTVSSNYTLEEVFVIVDDDPERRYVPDDFLNWSVAIDIAGLEDGEHTLTVWARDTIRVSEGVEVVFITGDTDKGDVTAVGLWDVVAVLALVGVFVYLLRTKPPRVSEAPSKG